ncbi:MAG: primosomal protein N' [Gammaproteobacteria bacterium]|nr:primosomal protein N' [Gammaproteobacteria bacterium]
MSPSPVILEIALPVPLLTNFDFLVNDVALDITMLEHRIGSRVLVPFGQQKKVGILLSVKTETDIELNKLKAIIDFLDEKPFISKEILKLALWSAKYYHHAIGEVMQQCLPVLVRQALSETELRDCIVEQENFWQLTELGNKTQSEDLKRAKRQSELLDFFKTHQQGFFQSQLKSQEISGWQAAIKKLEQAGLIHKQLKTINQNELVDTFKQISEKNVNKELLLKLNDEQQLALEQVLEKKNGFHPFLLYGITGSGKTEVYLQLIQSVLVNQKQALILVPEINLTPQLFERFEKRFNVPIATLHSSLNHKQRFKNWLLAAEGKAKIVIGTRSAIFTPMPDLGLIILDEEHDSSYKQQEGFRYHARDIAMIRANFLSIPVLLGTATPSFETLENVRQKKYQCLRLTKRAGNAIAPKISLMDVRNKQIEHGISYQLKARIEEELSQNNQIIIFQNRRGFAPITYCHQCGWMAQCPSCDAKLTTHQKGNYMLCHHCETRFPIPVNCLSCNSDQIEKLGAGTERIEQTLLNLFPDVEIFRIDRDTTRGKDQFHQLMMKVKDGHRQILVGTQMLSKGHHFPNVTLVVILDIDQGLFSTDFRAMEKMAQLIVQVAGRAGRGEKPGQVVLQTHQPEHPFYEHILSHGYEYFSQQAMEDRQQMQLPPYGYLALLRCDAKSESINLEFLNQCLAIAQQLLSNQTQESIQIIGPVPAPMQRKAGRFRSQVLVQCDHRQLLQQFIGQWLEHFPKNHRVKWSIDIDPQDMA